jgi:acetylornithine deacetylase/succinyl-diaminopimelate desuccinylase-like protein
MIKSPVDELCEFLRFPSISTSPECRGDVEACAQWLSKKLEAGGLESRVIPTEGHPVVLARTPHQEGLRTVLVYGHYDVQPVDPVELWASPPFEPRLAEGVIFARGAADNKGQIFAHVLGVLETLKEVGRTPVNVIFLIEGEEEIGSPSLEPFLLRHRAELQCDVVAVSDTGMVAAGVPTLTYGLRGVAALELRVTGPATDLHSGIFGGAVANPLTVISRLVAALHDSEGRVAVPGFYDRVEPLADWEREAWAKLPVGDSELQQLTGVPALAGEQGFSARERIWARPTAEVNGMGGGFQGKGTKTVIPREAFAKVTFRLVPRQQPAEVLESAKQYLEGLCPQGVKLEVELGHFGEAYLMNPGGDSGLAAQRALERTFGGEVALIREGGSIPIINTFARVLGVETLLLGLALPDCRAHAPNENFPVANFLGGIRLSRALMEELSR